MRNRRSLLDEPYGVVPLSEMVKEVEILFNGKNDNVIVVDDELSATEMIHERYISPQYDAMWAFKDDIAVVKQDGKYFHINRGLKPLYEERYDYLRDFKEELAIAKLNSKWFHITKDGKPAYEERYDWVGNFHEGLVAAKLHGKYFHITKDGKPAYEERYDAVGEFRHGLARVNVDYYCFYINKKGKIVEPIETTEGIGSRGDVLRIFKTDETYVFITGCFIGNLTELKSTVIGRYKSDSMYYNQYMKVIEKYESMMDTPDTSTPRGILIVGSGGAGGRSMRDLIDKLQSNGMVVFDEKDTMMGKKEHQDLITKAFNFPILETTNVAPVDRKEFINRNKRRELRQLGRKK